MPIPVTCALPGCDEVLTGRTDQRYHTAACRQADYRRRRTGGDDTISTDPRPATAKRGRQRITLDEALAAIGYSTWCDAYQLAARFAQEIDLAQINPDTARTAAAEIGHAIDIYRRIQAALHEVAALPRD